MLTFPTFPTALAWAKRHGREHCHACDMWHIVRHGDLFAVAIVSRNSGRVVAFVRPE